MIDSLKGTLFEADEDFAVVDVGGIRFRCEIPASSSRALPAQGGAVELKTRLSFNVNEGTFSLFGFASAEERDLFDILTRISGIGPRKGLMMLSQVEIAPFAQAIIRGDVAYLAGIKGIGKKTAERLIVELRESLVPFATPAPTAAPAIATAPQNVADAVQALVVLGVRPAIAERAVAEAVRVLGDRAATEALIREGLRHR